MFKEISIPLNSGLNLVAKIWGDPKNHPLLAIHGWLDNADSFSPLAPFLLDKFQLVALDLIGHGHSDHLPPAAMYNYIDWIEHLLEVANYLKFHKFSLLGHSMGAGIAPLFAACIPDRIHAMYLIEGLGPLSDPASHAVIRLQNYLKHSERGRKNKTYCNIENAIKTRMKNSDMTYQSAKLIVERGIKFENNIYSWRHDPRLLYPAPLRYTEPQIDAFLTAINCPTLLIWAENGYDFGSILIERRQQQLKNLSIHTIAGGHHMHMDSPSEIAAFILQYSKIV